MKLTAPLWLREFRGGERRLIRQPWAVPAFVAAWVIVAHAMDWEIPLGGPPPFIHYWPPGAIVALWGPQSALALAMVGIVSWSVISDRNDVDLRLSLLTPREIIWAKTFAPTLLSALLIAALAVGEAAWASSQSDQSVLLRCGLEKWALAARSGAFDIGPLIRGLLVSLFGFRTLLLALSLATLTSWLAVRRKDPGNTMIVSVLLFFAICMSAHIAEAFVRKQISHVPIERMILQDRVAVTGNPEAVRPPRASPVELHRAAAITILKEGAVVLFFRFILPLAWLLYWLRWSREEMWEVEWWSEWEGDAPA